MLPEHGGWLPVCGELCLDVWWMLPQCSAWPHDLVSDVKHVMPLSEGRTAAVLRVAALITFCSPLHIHQLLSPAPQWPCPQASCGKSLHAHLQAACPTPLYVCAALAETHLQHSAAQSTFTIHLIAHTLDMPLTYSSRVAWLFQPPIKCV